MLKTDMSWSAAWPGWLSFGLGITALCVAMVHLWAGPFAPQQDIGVTIGQIAADIWRSGREELAGAPQPAAVPLEWNIDRVLEVIKPLLAGLALATGALAMILHKGARIGMAGVAFGVGAVVFQFVAWAVMLVAGVILLVSIIYNLGDIVGG
jgi:hypothetical protein